MINEKNITVGKNSGFCFGVKRAVDLVEEQAGLGKKVYTYGPIIHNEEVTDALARKGVEILCGKEEWNRAERGTLIIRSHGVSKAEYEDMLQSGPQITHRPVSVESFINEMRMRFGLPCRVHAFACSLCDNFAVFYDISA